MYLTTPDATDALDCFEGAVEALWMALSMRDPEIAAHGRRVARLVERMALAAHGDSSGPFAARRFSGAEITALRYAGMLHDLGTLTIEEDLLWPPRMEPAQVASVEARFRDASARQGAGAARGEVCPIAAREALGRVEVDLALVRRVAAARGPVGQSDVKALSALMLRWRALPVPSPLTAKDLAMLCGPGGCARTPGWRCAARAAWPR